MGSRGEHYNAFHAVLIFVLGTMYMPAKPDGPDPDVSGPIDVRG
jgi:hypothetical protein